MSANNILIEKVSRGTTEDLGIFELVSGEKNTFELFLWNIAFLN